MDGWMDKVCYDGTFSSVQFSSVAKSCPTLWDPHESHPSIKKGNLAIATTWMDVADIKLSEISHTGKDEILYYFTYICII